jgi:hypothetical protein
MATDSSGNVYTTGFFIGSLDFDGDGVAELNNLYSPDDIFISKLNNNGGFIWAKQIGRGGTDIGYSVTVDSSGNVYVIGYFSAYNNGSGVIVDFDPGATTYNLNSAGGEDIFILKLDSNGNFLWAKSMGGTGNERGYDLAVDSNGNVYSTGYFSNTVDFDPSNGIFNLTSAGMGDIFVSKLNSTGDFVWAKRMGGAGSPSAAGFDEGRGIAVDSTGNVYTTGRFEPLAADFDPGTGVFNLTNEGGVVDIFISKLDSNGGFVWAKGIGGASIDIGYGITLDSISNMYITGSFWENVDFDPSLGTATLNSSGGSDIYVSKFNSNGEFLWAKGMGGSNSEQGSSIAIDSIGNVYTTGDFMSSTVDLDPGPVSYILTNTFYGYSNIFISKLNSSGNFVWAKSMGSTTNNTSADITLDNNSNVYTTGAFSGTVDFDPGIGTYNITAGSFDIFISKLEGDPIVLSSVVTNTNDSGPGSLRQAIQDTSSGGAITFEPSLAGQTIHLASELVVTKSVTFDGSNLTPPIKVSGDTDSDGYGDVLLMTVNPSATAIIKKIIFEFGNYSTYQSAGGINNFGNLTIQDSGFENNHGSIGGAVFNGINATAMIENSFFNQNVAETANGGEGGGGGIGNLGDLTISSSQFFENFAVEGGGAIANAQNGSTTITNSVFTLNSAGLEGGGAIYNIDNVIIISDSTFDSNTSTSDGGAIYNAIDGTTTLSNVAFTGNVAAHGGGIANLSVLTLTNGTLSNNSADWGGGIANLGTLTITNSNLSSNSTFILGAGGGIMNFDTGILTVEDSSISNNSADNGGGIFNFNIANITNSTISGNSASTNGGGISTWFSLNLTNSTVVGNNAETGGGVFNLGTLTTTNVTFSENSAATGGGVYNSFVTPGFAGAFNYSNTIIANSTSGADCYSDGVINTNVNNLVENNAALPNQCGLSVLSDDPKLGSLADNGGVTQTMALLPNSPAIDAGDDTTCAAPPVSNSSQNGVTRPQGSHCDIGAFEYSTPFPDLIITNVTISPTVPLPNQTFEISITIKNQGGTSSANTVFRDVYINRDPSTLIDPATGCPSPGDFFRSDSYASLPAGMTDTKTITITGGLPSGNHQFWFYVDSRCLVDEGGGSNSVP